jgi:hypothetical protein
MLNGGALSITANSSSVVIDNCDFSSNSLIYENGYSSETFGGAMYTFSSELSLSQTTVNNNSILPEDYFCDSTI